MNTRPLYDDIYCIGEVFFTKINILCDAKVSWAWWDFFQWNFMAIPYIVDDYIIYLARKILIVVQAAKVT